MRAGTEAIAAHATPWWRAEVPRRAAGQAARASRLSFTALAAYTVILVAAPQEFVAGLAPFRLALLVGSLAVLAHGVDRLAGRLRAPVWPVELSLLALLLAWAVLMVPFSYHPGGSVNMMLGLWLKSIAVFLLLVGCVDSSARFRTMVVVLMGCSFVIAITALRHFASGTFVEGTDNRIAGYGESAMAGNPNDLALLLNIVLPVATMWCVTAGRVGRLLGFGVVAVLAAGVIVTFSRAGILTLGLSSALLLWRFVRRGAVWPFAVAAVGAIVLLYAMPEGLAERLSTVSNLDADRTGSAQDRWRDTVAAATFALQHPLIGAGAGLDYLALNDVRGRAWLSVHNVYLNYAVDLGVIGLTLFLAIFVSAYRGVAHVERRRSDRLGALAGGVRIALVAFALSAFFHPVAYHAYFYYLAGLAVAVRRIDVQPEERT